jgi:hypothetical protein
MLAEADAVTSDAAADRVTRAASAAKDRRLITRDQCDHVQNRVRATLGTLRETAKPVDAEDLGRQAAQAAADGAQPDMEMPENEPGSAGKSQLTRLHTQFTKLGFGGDEREQKLAIAETVARRRPLTGPEEGRSSKNLSWTEAAALIERLDGFDSRDELIAWMAGQQQEASYE